MPYNDHQAETMRADLGFQPGLDEKKMFGGLAFMLHGNMVCGVHKNGAMYRVGKTREQAALDAGAGPMTFTGRKMGGMVELDDGQFAEDALRQTLTEMSLANAAGLPPKDQG